MQKIQARERGVFSRPGTGGGDTSSAHLFAVEGGNGVKHGLPRISSSGEVLYPDQKKKSKREEKGELEFLLGERKKNVQPLL